MTTTATMMPVDHAGDDEDDDDNEDQYDDIHSKHNAWSRITPAVGKEKIRTEDK